MENLGQKMNESNRNLPNIVTLKGFSGVCRPELRDRIVGRVGKAKAIRDDQA